VTLIIAMLDSKFELFLEQPWVPASTLILGNAKAAVVGITSNGFTRGSDFSLSYL